MVACVNSEVVDEPVFIDQRVIFQADNLTVCYPGSPAFKPIDKFHLTLYQHEITCILGRSGCGKTTLLKCLGGFVPGESEGGVLFKGQYIEKPTPDIVMIFQENNLYPWLSVKGNVRFGLKFKRDILDKRARVRKIIDTVGLSDAKDRYPHQLSGGMRQRVAIARALVSEPSVLLLDEPFSALDVSLRRRMQDLLRQLWEDTNKTMVMVTHNVEEAIRIAHRVVVIGNTPAEVLIDVKTEDEPYRDRYSKQYLELQKEIEAVIYE